MNNFYVLLNHDLLPKQIEEIESKLNAKVKYFPDELRAIWKNIEAPIAKCIEPILKYIDKEVSSSDIVLVQGHTGATYLVVNRVKDVGAKAVYAHSPKGTKDDKLLSDSVASSMRVFEHLGFLEYGK